MYVNFYHIRLRLKDFVSMVMNKLKKKKKTSSGSPFSLALDMSHKLEPLSM